MLDVARKRAARLGLANLEVVQHASEGWTRAELEAHVRDEHSTFTWLLEPVLERAGFEIREAERSSAYAAYVCVRRPHD
jgi:hypothetical protein